MGTEVGLNLSQGKIKFAGNFRGYGDGGHFSYEISLPGRKIMFGEWYYKFIEGGIGFDVEIDRFGYLNPMEIGNPYPNAREKLTKEEIVAVEALLAALFSDPEATAEKSPFSLAPFTGKLIFLPDWIRAT